MSTPRLRSTTGIPLPPPSPLAMSLPPTSEPAEKVTESTALLSQAAHNLRSSQQQQSQDDDAAITPANPTEDLPELKSYTATTREDKVEALKLVADSVAQQRQTASKALIFHPVNLSIYIALMAVVGSRLYKTPADIAIVATTLAGLTMACLMAVRYVTKDYILEAEKIGWDLLDGANKDREQNLAVLVTKWGDQIIGALVLNWVFGENGKGKKKKGGRGLIRAWTVKMRYRRRGVGTELLEQAVEMIAKKGGESIDFADDHVSKCNPFDLLQLFLAISV
jgi:ribosomal protein S18 acetylase RimI-like enzyme